MRPSRRCACPKAGLSAALAAALTFASLASGAQAGTAEPPGARPAASACLPAGQLQRRLAEAYGESPRARGVTSGGALLELWVSPGGRSFSLVVTLPPAGGRAGLSCLIGAGEGWRRAADPPAGGAASGAAGGPET